MASDFLAFTEGENFLLAGGLPSTCYFLLSTTPVSGFTTSTTLAGGVGEITGTGYARQSQAAPVPSSGSVTFGTLTWNTGGANNWPNNVETILLATTANNSGHAICAWNVIPGGGPRDLSQQFTTYNNTPTLNTTS